MAPSADTPSATGDAASGTALASKLTLEERKQLCESLDDPLNRWYRYPAARALLHVLGGLPLRPDHITYIHMAFGVAAAGLVAWGTKAALIGAFFALEIRDILDCYDGVLARAKKMSSPRGRALDEAADAISFIALAIGLAIYTKRHDPLVPNELAAAGALTSVIVGAYCAHACDFYKRRLGTALKEERDGIKDELEQKRQQRAKEKVGPLTNFGIWVDRWQYIYWDPTYANGDPVKTVLARAHRPGLKFMVRLVGMMSWENGIFIMHLGLLTGWVTESWAAGTAYGLLMIIVGRITAWRALAGRLPGEEPAAEVVKSAEAAS